MARIMEDFHSGLETVGGMKVVKTEDYSVGLNGLPTAFSVLSSEDHWFGVTYQEDKPSVVESFRNLIDSGAYRPDLYSDL